MKFVRKEMSSRLCELVNTKHLFWVILFVQKIFHVQCES